MTTILGVGNGGSFNLSNVCRDHGGVSINAPDQIAAAEQAEIETLNDLIVLLQVRERLGRLNSDIETLSASQPVPPRVVLPLIRAINESDGETAFERYLNALSSLLASSSLTGPFRSPIQARYDLYQAAAADLGSLQFSQARLDRLMALEALQPAELKDVRKTLNALDILIAEMRGELHIAADVNVAGLRTMITTRCQAGVRQAEPVSPPPVAEPIAPPPAGEATEETPQEDPARRPLRDWLDLYGRFDGFYNYSSLDPLDDNLLGLGGLLELDLWVTENNAIGLVFETSSSREIHQYFYERRANDLLAGLVYRQRFETWSMSLAGNFFGYQRDIDMSVNGQTYLYRRDEHLLGELRFGFHAFDQRFWGEVSGLAGDSFGAMARLGTRWSAGRSRLNGFIDVSILSADSDVEIRSGVAGSFDLDLYMIPGLESALSLRVFSRGEYEHVQGENMFSVMAGASLVIGDPQLNVVRPAWGPGAN